MPAFACRYKLGKVLGAGSFGIVREATERKTGRRYACKTIPKVPARPCLATLARAGPAGHASARRPGPPVRACRGAAACTLV